MDGAGGGGAGFDDGAVKEGGVGWVVVHDVVGYLCGVSLGLGD